MQHANPLNKKQASEEAKSFSESTSFALPSNGSAMQIYSGFALEEDAVDRDDYTALNLSETDEKNLAQKKLEKNATEFLKELKGRIKCAHNFIKFIDELQAKRVEKAGKGFFTKVGTGRVLFDVSATEITPSLFGASEHEHYLIELTRLANDINTTLVVGFKDISLTTSQAAEYAKQINAVTQHTSDRSYLKKLPELASELESTNTMLLSLVETVKDKILGFKDWDTLFLRMTEYASIKMKSDPTQAQNINSVSRTLQRHLTDISQKLLNIALDQPTPTAKTY